MVRFSSNYNGASAKLILVIFFDAFTGGYGMGLVLLGLGGGMLWELSAGQSKPGQP